MSELFELATLSFIASFRSSVLSDSRVLSKCLDDQDQTEIHKSSGYLRIAGVLSSKDILDIVEIFFKKMILNFFSNSKPIVELDLDMLRNFVNSNITRKYLMKLETTKDLMETHFTKYVFLNSPDMLEYLNGFYKILTIFWDVNDTVDNFYKYMKPCSEFIKNLVAQDTQTLLQSRNDVLRVIEILNGVSQGFSSPEAFYKFFSWFNEGHSTIIQLVFEHFCDDKVVLKSTFKLMKELVDNAT